MNKFWDKSQLIGKKGAWHCGRALYYHYLGRSYIELLIPISWICSWKIGTFDGRQMVYAAVKFPLSEWWNSKFQNYSESRNEIHNINTAYANSTLDQNKLATRRNERKPFCLKTEVIFIRHKSSRKYAFLSFVSLIYNIW